MDATTAAESNSGLARSDLLRRLACVAVASGGAGVLATRIPDAWSAAPSPSRDRKILNFILLLEYAQESLYARAVRTSAIRGELRRYARVALEHERAHVDVVRRALGPAARERPTL